MLRGIPQTSTVFQIMWEHLMWFISLPCFWVSWARVAEWDSPMFCASQIFLLTSTCRLPRTGVEQRNIYISEGKATCGGCMGGRRGGFPPLMALVPRRESWCCIFSCGHRRAARGREPTPNLPKKGGGAGGAAGGMLGVRSGPDCGVQPQRGAGSGEAALTAGESAAVSWRCAGWNSSALC